MDLLTTILSTLGSSFLMTLLWFASAKLVAVSVNFIALFIACLVVHIALATMVFFSLGWWAILLSLWLTIVLIKQISDAKFAPDIVLMLLIQFFILAGLTAI